MGSGLIKLGFEDGLDVGGKVDSNSRGGIGALVGFDVVGFGTKLGLVEDGFVDVGLEVESEMRGGVCGLDVGINDDLRFELSH